MSSNDTIDRLITKYTNVTPSDTAFIALLDELEMAHAMTDEPTAFVTMQRDPWCISAADIGGIDNGGDRARDDAIRKLEPWLPSELQGMDDYVG